MPNAPSDQIITYIADKLREGESIDRITKAIKGMGPDQARDLVLKVRGIMKWEVRKQAFWKLLGSFLLLLVFGGIFVATGRLFYIILPFAAAGFLWGADSVCIRLGLRRRMTPVGRECSLRRHSDDSPLAFLASSAVSHRLASTS